MAVGTSLSSTANREIGHGRHRVRVSIGLPFFNNEATLSQAIQSVFAQTYEEWELILVDDGSTDRSLEIARRVEDPRVRVVADRVNRGLSYRLNEITELARGEYVARMDADDLMHPERIARQVAYLDAHPEIEVVGTALYSIDAANNILGLRAVQHRHRDPADALRQGWLNHATVMGRREWFRRNPYDVSFRRAQDRELWCRTCRDSRFAQIGEALYFCKEEQSFSLAKYVQSCVTDRRIFRLHGPALVGYPYTTWLIVRSCLKSWTYRLAVAFGGESMLIRRRNQKVSDEDRLAAAKAIERILATSVPGLSVGSRNVGAR